MWHTLIVKMRQFWKKYKIVNWNSSTPTEWVSMKFITRVLLPKYVSKIQASLKSDTKNGYFTLRPVYGFANNSSQNGKWFRQKLHSHQTYFAVSNVFYNNRSVYEVMCLVIIGRAGYICIYSTGELCVGYLSLQTHTEHLLHLLLSHCNNGCTLVPQRHVTVHCQTCLILSNATLCLGMVLLNAAFQCLWWKGVYGERAYQFFISEILFSFSILCSHSWKDSAAASNNRWAMPRDFNTEHRNIIS